MGGIYIHIPFCRQACSYCNFHFTVNLSNKSRLLSALLKEIDLRKDYLSGEIIETVYFGGGTPSLLTADEVKKLFDKLGQTFQIADEAEITLEANPDDLTEGKIRQLRTTAVNRLSIGVQSFDDDDLNFLHRAHNSKQAELSVMMAQDAGFENTTIDLIYGIPERLQGARSKGQANENPSPVPRQSSIQKWLGNLEKLRQYGIPHFSAYCLTIEPKTILGKMIRQKKFPGVNEENSAIQFETLMDFAAENHYDHYEISSFAKPGLHSRHNTAYWTGKKYLGLGPSAHSYDGISRQWNIANNTLYIQSLAKGKLNFEKEVLSETDRFNEYLMTALRTKWGIDKNYLRENFGAMRFIRFEKAASRFLQQQMLVADNGKITLSRSGKLIADRIISEMFEAE